MSDLPGMDCRRAFDVDLAAFLADARAPEWAEFRAHYPGCPACAAEVRAWTELDRLLHAALVHDEPGHVRR